jgi:hypothetical protein
LPVRHGPDHRCRRSIHFDNTRSQDFVPSDDLQQALLKAAEVQPSNESQTTRDVVSRVLRIEPLKKPQPFLMRRWLEALRSDLSAQGEARIGRELPVRKSKIAPFRAFNSFFSSDVIVPLGALQLKRPSASIVSRMSRLRR